MQCALAAGCSSVGHGLFAAGKEKEERTTKKEKAGSASCSGAQGVLQRLACDGPDSPWLLTGTSRGHLTLWDLRFQLPLTQWDHPSGQPVEALAPAVAPVGHLGLRGGGKGSSPLVYIAAGGHEVGLWDIEEGKCHQVSISSINHPLSLQDYLPQTELHTCLT